jgi:DNA polymerase III delta prime subunit
MITRKINTNLMKKLETFKVMALGEAIQTPILLIGPPGVAKTAAVIDFAKASLGKLKGEDLFLLETDEGTKSNAIKGNVDLQALTTENVYKVDSPVTRAKVVVVNEIDKASASLRNSLLGVMNERVLFNGKEKLPCKWNNFIATCNEIPDDEKDSPFWDRFLITHDVKRLSTADMMNYYNKGGKNFRQDHNITIPEQADIDAITLDPNKLKTVLDATYSDLSDRALSFLPVLIKNVMCVWGYDESRGMIKTAELLVGKTAAKNLAKNLVPAPVRDVYDAIDTVGMCVSPSDYNDAYDKFEKAYTKAEELCLLTDSDKEQMKLRMEEEEAKLEFLKEDVVNEDALS